MLSDLCQARETGEGKTRGLLKERKCGSYQHSPQQKNRDMMKAKGREAARLTSRDRQRVKVKMTERQVGRGKERIRGK